MSSLATTIFKRSRSRALPSLLPSAAPLYSRRPVTILAPGPNPDSPVIVESQPDPSPIDASSPATSLPPPPSSSSSQHPYASLLFPPPSAEDLTPSPLTTLPSPTPSPPLRPSPQHPFDTHAFVLHMEKSEFLPDVARALMDATRQLIVRGGDKVRGEVLHNEDVENAAYLHKAALAELRTELSVRARNDGLTLRSSTALLRREVDGLGVKVKEDVLTLKHDIEMDMNNRKSETRTEQKGYDIAIEEINNKFTISLGDLRTEIEQAKWDATRKAIAIIAGVVFTVVTVTTLSAPAAPAPPAPPAPSTFASGKPAMVSQGSGDARLMDDEDVDLSRVIEERLRERVGREEGMRRRVREMEMEAERGRGEVTLR